MRDTNETEAQRRMFDAGRREQGFRDQAHLDAFYAYFDHTENCAECKKPGESVWIDDGWQPTCNRCEEANRLYKLSH